MKWRMIREEQRGRGRGYVWEEHREGCREEGKLRQESITESLKFDGKVAKQESSQQFRTFKIRSPCCSWLEDEAQLFGAIPAMTMWDSNVRPNSDGWQRLQKKRNRWRAFYKAKPPNTPPPPPLPVNLLVTLAGNAWAAVKKFGPFGV